MIDSPDEIFGSDDASLFECNDKDLKAKAICNSIIPRLLEIVRGCVTEIRRVYGVDALDVSTLCWSPHSAESRGNGYACDFRSASAGLEVKRVKGRPMRILELRLLLSRKGVWPMLHLHRGNLEKDILGAMATFVKQHEVEILSLIVAMAGQMFVYKDKHSIASTDWFPLSKSISALTNFRVFDMSIHGFQVPMPIERNKHDRAVALFTVLFPLYWALAEIGEGREPIAFGKMVRKAFEYRKCKAIEWGKASSKQADCFVEDNSIAKTLADARSKVPVGRRWQVFERDNWRCVSCGRGADEGAILEVDHILPRSKGGKDTLDNFQTLCRECNIGKSNKSQKDLRKKEVRVRR